MNHVMNIIHKWNMFLHELGDNTIFHTMKNHNSICTKTNMSLLIISIFSTHIFNKILDYQGGQIVNNNFIKYPIQVEQIGESSPLFNHRDMSRQPTLIIDGGDFVISF
jgi:hypothetical protein